METYKKIVFVWNEPKSRIKVPERLRFCSAKEVATDQLVDAIGRVMAHSMDRHDQKEVLEYGAQRAAARFLAEANEHFNYELSWWQLAYNAQNELVGFVLPVTFPDCQKDGLEEGTIYYMGVLAEKRGNGYAYDLLCYCTHAFQALGVWRIYCDTDIYNAPMIATFKKVGYKQEGEAKIVDL